MEALSTTPYAGEVSHLAALQPMLHPFPFFWSEARVHGTPWSHALLRRPSSIIFQRNLIRLLVFAAHVSFNAKAVEYCRRATCFQICLVFNRNTDVGFKVYSTLFGDTLFRRLIQWWLRFQMVQGLCYPCSIYSLLVKFSVRPIYSLLVKFSVSPSTTCSLFHRFMGGVLYS
jgi:hypothetical protein